METQTPTPVKTTIMLVVRIFSETGCVIEAQPTVFAIPVEKCPETTGFIQYLEENHNDPDILGAMFAKSKYIQQIRPLFFSIKRKIKKCKKIEASSIVCNYDCESCTINIIKQKLPSEKQFIHCLLEEK